MAIPDPNPVLTARQAGLAACKACGTLHPWPGAQRCSRCGGRVEQRRPLSLQRSWAFLLCGMLAYVPANIFPVMTTRTLTGSSSDTIVSGVVTLFGMGSYVVATIIFVASICIPCLKFMIIGGIALSLQYRWPLSDHTRHWLHSVTEFIGRWSMVDVFVVAVLAALIQLGSFVNIEPGVGINAFAISVVFTMLSASALDSRLVWDRTGHGG